MHILIIEDELLIQKALQKFFEKQGHNVLTTSSGIDAINLLKKNNFDIVVCDIMLKDITGFEVIEETKQIMSATEISDKFIIITAYSSTQIIETAKSYKCRIYQKPFKNIIETVNLILKRNET